MKRLMHLFFYLLLFCKTSTHRSLFLHSGFLALFLLSHAAVPVSRGRKSCFATSRRSSKFRPSFTHRHLLFCSPRCPLPKLKTCPLRKAHRYTIQIEYLSCALTDKSFSLFVPLLIRDWRAERSLTGRPLEEPMPLDWCFWPRKIPRLTTHQL